ncbi:nicotinate-nucleotide--dimethylbenzimidazole phosphoribosyltransferase [Inhella inkyongensis]|uniref:Nicotinate-nucleotide--dimethylbenzimidazole phosphoribosyltransferase n=1 Tax=Inhella inkyongensis TaxID=392593 RepID=A0A840S8U0_9BURK|nr:nicotinate-nucleotide--dimethylbenzimidazole phosphoribosyltransferase [Inhella inkyongensis]MBB5204840.1 nicotinate-nucleotide--dimethylbenzimidazole phosphoribosyltransferase [Inhella inkyongensis]
MNLFDIPSLHDADLQAQVQHKLDRKTKPLGALGRIEQLALRIACIQGRLTPSLEAPQLLVCAADHGLSRQGVSAYPREVSWQMVLNMLAGGAAVSVLARQQGLTLTVADCGVAHVFEPQPGLAICKVAGLEEGTRDATQGPAMTASECAQALENGAALARRLPGKALLLGEMGIGNTSAATLLMQRLTGMPLVDCVGRGTGLDDASLARKTAVLQQALAANSQAREPQHILAALGGLEIATLTGAVLAAAQQRRVILVDGFITTAAVAVAAALAPAVLERCVFAHASAESGHARWLQRLGVQPLLDLGLRLGEGSGAALAWPLLVSAVNLLNEMASFDSAGVSESC